MSARGTRLFVGAAATMLALTGCRGSFLVQAGGGASAPSQAAPGTTVTRSQVSLSADSALGAVILLGIIAADGVRADRGSAGGGTSRNDDVPSGGTGRHELDPSRSIRVQDCSRPVDLAGGNLVCR
jgi:hypothetical protein